MAKEKNLESEFEREIGRVRLGALATSWVSAMSSPLGMNTRRHSLKPPGRGTPSKKAS